MVVDRCGRWPRFDVRAPLGWSEAFEGEGGARFPLPFSLEEFTMLASSVCSAGVDSAGCFVLLWTRLSRLRAIPLLDRLWGLLGDADVSVGFRGSSVLRGMGEDIESSGSCKGEVAGSR